MVRFSALPVIRRSERPSGDRGGRPARAVSPPCRVPEPGEADDNGEIVVCAAVRAALAPLLKQIDALDEAIEAIDNALEAQAKGDEKAKRLMTIPGIGPVTATAVAATMRDVEAFASAREFAAFLGLTPRQASTGGKEGQRRVWLGELWFSRGPGASGAKGAA